jgi:hypothetical protein
VTQPARDNPRQQRKHPTAQLCCFIDAEVKDAATAATGRGKGKETLRSLVERALRRQLEEDAKAAPGS